MPGRCSHDCGGGSCGDACRRRDACASAGAPRSLDRRCSLRLLLRWGGLLLAGPALTVAACGSAGPPAADFGEDTVVIDVTGRGFAPAEAAARVGQPVVWRNLSGRLQTVTADPRLAEGGPPVELPAGAAPFNSGRLGPNEIYRRRFDVPGTYRYVSLPDDSGRMAGTLVVGR